ncbi:sporulation stage II, protein E [Allorhodopirellula solitaria]|uniref:Stage II sporulation protein E (SpoIIE) n=1 Tax=Allorhodopirellula solitaria TaxID=2527987 RepID=A0A5C5X0N2_9BACT|nr:sporulation stage II, protein E [Allorhodopirellula solitaria]TWT56159.1 hypothetical protein CA85_45010 [Allorhodopirellula solitaria]
MSTSLPSYLKIHCADHETDRVAESQVESEAKWEQTELAVQATSVLINAAAKKGSDQVDQVLADALLATDATAAAVYLLDDATEQLNTRFVFGMLPAHRLGTSRPLRGARGDLEAMVQGTFTMQDLPANRMDQHSIPEPFASAICLCLNGTELPIGTLWLYSNAPHAFDEKATAAARLAATDICHTLVSLHRLSSPANGSSAPASARGRDLIDEENAAPDFDADRFVEAMEPLPGHTPPAIDDAPSAMHEWEKQISDWQCDTLPLGTRLARDWMVDGMVESPLAVAQSWHHWDVLPDGILAIAMCQFGHAWAPQGDLGDTLDATVARAALQAHLGYRHTPQEALMRTLHSLLQVRDAAIDESGRPSLSLLYAHVDPQSGRAAISSIGQWSSLIASPQGYRSLNLDRAATIAAEEIPGELPIMSHETTLLDGEALLVTSAQWMGIASEAPPLTPRLDETIRRDGIDHDSESVRHQIGASLQKAMMEGERSPLAALRRHTASIPLNRERAALALLHQANPIS